MLTLQGKVIMYKWHAEHALQLPGSMMVTFCKRGNGGRPGHKGFKGRHFPVFAKGCRHQKAMETGEVTLLHGGWCCVPHPRQESTAEL